MVDGMLGCDAVFVASEPFVCIGVVSDDDDVVPATLMAHVQNRSVVLLRRSRRPGTGPNDQVLSRRGLRIHVIED